MKSREEILSGAVEVPRETVTVPAWGGDVIIQAVSLASRRLIRFVEAPMEVEAGSNGRARYENPSDEEKQVRRIIAKVILGVVGPDGEPFFLWDDADALRSEANFPITIQVAARIQDLTSEIAAANTLEAAKND